MTNYEELYNALKVIKVYCESRQCEDCAMSTDGHTCRVSADIPALWDIHEPKATLWED